MSFVTRLRPDLIAIAPPWHGFRDTAAGLVAMLVHANAIPAAQEDDAVHAVVARERESSTAVIETGVGVPHARLGGLRETVVALAVSRTGLYEPVPTVAIPIVALVLSPPGASNDHLGTLASIATLLRSPELRDALLRAADPPAALEALDRHARSAPLV
jgi:mannitol/fructose-specific phosphotransferase system IIA component (Ntr-type)